MSHPKYLSSDPADGAMLYSVPWAPPSAILLTRVLFLADASEAGRTCNGLATAALPFAGWLMARLKPPHPQSTGRPTRRSGQRVERLETITQAVSCQCHWMAARPPSARLSRTRRADKGAWGDGAGERGTVSRQPLPFVAADVMHMPAHRAAGSDAGGGQPATTLGCRRNSGGGGGVGGARRPPRVGVAFFPVPPALHPLTRPLLVPDCSPTPVPHPRWQGGTPRTPPATHTCTTRSSLASIVIQRAPAMG